MLDKLEKSVSKAFDRVASQGGPVQNPELSLYEHMTPEVMNVIAEVYGPDNLVKYIQTMEARRMKDGGQNA